MGIAVRVLCTKGCPNTPPTIDLIRETAGELGVEVEIERIEISTPGEAETHRFPGSPTVQVNGFDIDPAVRHLEAFGLT